MNKMAKSNLTNKTYPDGDDPNGTINMNDKMEYSSRWDDDNDSPKPCDYSHTLFSEFYNSTRNNQEGESSNPLI